MAPLERAAITSAGVVLDFDDDCAISFEHSKECSPSHGAKEKGKEFHRMIRAAQIAHAQDEIDLGLRNTSLGETVKMWIRSWPGIGLDEVEVHLALACKQVRRMAWFDYKTGVIHPGDGVYLVDESGIVHQKVSIEVDGPALTPDGTVVDLDGGHKTFFSHSKEMSPSHAAKQKAKDEFRMMRAVELAHYNDEVLMGYTAPVQSVLCADATGMVHTGLPVKKKDKDSQRSMVQQKKVIHRKKRSIGSPKLSMEEENVVLVLDSDGMVQAKSPKHVHTAKKIMPFPSLAMKGDGILCVDASGIVHTGKGFKTPPELIEPEHEPRFVTEPDAELSPQNPGAYPDPCQLPVIECM